MYRLWDVWGCGVDREIGFWMMDQGELEERWTECSIQTSDLYALPAPFYSSSNLLVSPVLPLLLAFGALIVLLVALPLSF